MTTALQALSRMDDGTFSPADTLLADRYDLHCQAGACVWPDLMCPHGVTGDCHACFLDHDDEMRRAEDQ